jgi:hypothetical protein
VTAWLLAGYRLTLPRVSEAAGDSSLKWPGLAARPHAFDLANPLFTSAWPLAGVHRE